MTDLALPFNLETELERRIADDPAWREGIEWGRPRLCRLCTEMPIPAESSGESLGVKCFPVAFDGD